MYPPLFDTIKNVAAVKAVLGSSPRVYPHGMAPPPANVIRPYAVFQIVNGLPENYLGTRPDIDSFTTQVDVYADTVASATAAAQALRDALEPVAYVVRWGGQFKDPDTNLFTYSFDVDWLTPR